MSATRARVNPQLTFGELWPHLVDLTPSEVIAPFLRVDRRADWKSMVRGQAAALRNQGHVLSGHTWRDVTDRLEETAATTSVRDALSIDIYLGRPNCPVRLAVYASLRPHSDHPAQAHVDDVVTAAQGANQGGGGPDRLAQRQA